MQQYTVGTSIDKVLFFSQKFELVAMDDKEKIGSSIKRMGEDISEQREKKKKLRQMELFVLDNSLRESTVGQLRGHTIDNKWKIYEQVLILFH